jgi:hypothetical protein
MDPSLTPGSFSPNQPASNPIPTPQQIQSAYAQANSLKAQGVNPQPMQSWTQGMAQIVKALAGQYGGGQADQMQRQLNQAQAGAIPGPAPYMPTAFGVPLAGPSWGGGNILSGDAFGGTATAPLPGLTAADYS